VTWAQRSSETDEDKNIVYLSVNAVDLQHPKVELTAAGVTVEGVQRETNNVYKVNLQFYEPIDEEVTIPDHPHNCFSLHSQLPSVVSVLSFECENGDFRQVGGEFSFRMLILKKSTKHVTDRGVHFLLHKTTKKAEYWPRLTESSKKEHFIRTDFDKVPSPSHNPPHWCCG